MEIAAKHQGRGGRRGHDRNFARDERAKTNLSRRHRNRFLHFVQLTGCTNYVNASIPTDVFLLNFHFREYRV